MMGNYKAFGMDGGFSYGLQSAMSKLIAGDIGMEVVIKAM